jgi:hypothetical protein
VHLFQQSKTKNTFEDVYFVQNALGILLAGGAVTAAAWPSAPAVLGHTAVNKSACSSALRERGKHEEGSKSKPKPSAHPQRRPTALVVVLVQPMAPHLAGHDNL